MSTKKPAKKAATNGSAAGKNAPTAKAVAAEPDADKAGTVDTDASSRPTLTPQAMEKIAALRGKIQTSVGQVVLAMMNLPRYRNQTLNDLTHLIIEPLLRDRLAIASSRPKDTEEDNAAAETLAGIAIWASVSDDVDAKIREQTKGGAFPIRLASEDWVSGEKLWLLDVIAPNRKLATAVLANFSQVAKDKPVAIHPIVARSVDPELLKKMKGKSAGDANGAKVRQELTADIENKGEA
ncbi:toxin-activating lysine-acyltransferase [Sphingorhabdus sp. Alg231-15]|uniref:toxin-activating lysine-acyltransferase n=1 Tax=Sphingorhabdus sp. Alg231-15 TaxID=1922222 RepID=UPI000D561BC4